MTAYCNRLREPVTTPAACTCEANPFAMQVNRSELLEGGTLPVLLRLSLTALSGLLSQPAPTSSAPALLQQQSAPAPVLPEADLLVLLAVLELLAADASDLSSPGRQVRP